MGVPPVQQVRTRATIETDGPRRLVLLGQHTDRCSESTLRQTRLATCKQNVMPGVGCDLLTTEAQSASAGVVFLTIQDSVDALYPWQHDCHWIKAGSWLPWQRHYCRTQAGA